MRRARYPLTAALLAALAFALGAHDNAARWYAVAVAVFLTAGLAITATFIPRGGTQ